MLAAQPLPDSTPTTDPALTSLEPTPLTQRIAPALVGLGLLSVITWQEAKSVLDAVEQRDREREDWVEFVAVKRYRLYTLLGGTQLTVGGFRAKVRRWLQTGEEL